MAPALVRFWVGGTKVSSEAGGVGGGESGGDLGGDVDEAANWKRLAFEERAEGFAFEEFADDVLLCPGFRLLDTEVVDGDDIGVIERGDGAGFALEAAAQVG